MKSDDDDEILNNLWNKNKNIETFLNTVFQFLRKKYACINKCNPFKNKKYVPKCNIFYDDLKIFLFFYQN